MVCRYSYDSVQGIPQKPLHFTDKYLGVKKVLMDTFFGPPNEGVYSASVQRTLYLMGKATLDRSAYFVCVFFFHVWVSRLSFCHLFFLNKANILCWVLNSTCSWLLINAYHVYARINYWLINVSDFLTYLQSNWICQIFTSYLSTSQARIIKL